MVWQKYLGPEAALPGLKLAGILAEGQGPAHLETVEYGPAAALWKTAEEIGLPTIIDSVVGKARRRGLTLGQYITIAAISRCIAPCSKAKLGRWFAKDWLSTQFAVDAKVLNAQTYWNHFQRIAFRQSVESRLSNGAEGSGQVEARAASAVGQGDVGAGKSNPIGEIELRVGKAVAERFGLNLSGVLYDSTNFFTFSQGGRDKVHGNGSTILRFGHNKEGRNGNRLVAYWVLCTRDTGVPLMHETYPGNRQDAEVFKSIPPLVERRIKALGGNPKDVTLVFDNGNLSPDGFKAVVDAKLEYIASRRPSEHKELLHVPSKQYTECTMPNGKEVQYYATTARIYGDDRTTFVVLDPAAHEKRIAEFRFKLARRILAIKAYFQDGGRLDPATLAGKKGQGQKWLEKSAVETKVAEMAQKAPFKGIISFAVTGPAKVTPTSRKRLALSVAVDVAARKRHEETLGKSVLFTSRGTWAPEDVIWVYREKYVVEHAFERMKCPLSIAVRPMYHHADPCIRGHVFTCVLALLLLSLLRLKLARKGIFASFPEIMSELSAVKITRIYPTPKALPITKVNRTRGLANKIVNALGLRHFAKERQNLSPNPF